MSRFASLLLAAGRGTRLRPITRQIPKPALPLLDSPLGAYGTVDLTALGGPLFINVSHGGELIRDALLPFAPHAGYLEESPEPFGTAVTLLHLKERTEGPVVTRNADSLTDASVVDAIAAHSASGALATIVTQAVPDRADLIVEDGRAVRFVDRRVESVGGDMWLGISVFEREALEQIAPDGPRDLATGLLAPLIARGEVAVHRHDGYFMDVGTIDRYVRASIDVLNGLMPRLTTRGQTIEVAGGRAYVADGARVDVGCLGPGAVVLEGATVPPDAFVTRAIVWRNENVPGGTRVEDGVWVFGALER